MLWVTQDFFESFRVLLSDKVFPQCLCHTPGGGSRKNFDRDAHVTFLGLKFHNLLFFWIAQNECYFFFGGGGGGGG